jgi:hypothetical protein
MLHVVKGRIFRILRGGVKVNAEWIYIYFIDWTALFAAQKSTLWVDINLLTPELNPSTQRCLTSFTGDLAY